jgi:hypothetical protein
MMILSITVALSMASILLWAGTEKLRNLQPLSSTLSQLGVPAWAAPFLGALIAIAEVAVAGGLLFRPQAVWTQGGVVALASAFALAGLVALTRNKVIRCSCFGAGGRGHLGKTQIIALLPWLAAVWLLRLGGTEVVSPSAGVFLFTVAALTITIVRAPAVSRAWMAARSDRFAAKEMYWWKWKRSP